MRKIILSLFLLLITPSLFSAGVEIIPYASQGMGKAGLADKSVSINPSNIINRKEIDSSLKTYFSIEQDYYRDELSKPIGLFQSPSMRLGAEVFGTNLSLTLNLENFLDSREYSASSEKLSYNGYNRFLLQLDWSFEIEEINFGMRVKGGSVSKRANFELRDNLLLIPDYIVNTFFSKYNIEPNSDFFSLGFASQIDFNDNFSLALMSESDLNLYASEDSVISYLKGISIGGTFESDIYSESNQLNAFVYKVSLDLVNIGNPLNREVRIGNEIKMELGNNNSVAFRFGYYENKPTIAKIFLVDSEKAISTFAFSYNSLNFDSSLILSIPFKTYYKRNNGLNIGVNAVIRF